MEAEPGQLDLWKAERSAAIVDRALLGKNVPAIQRAVIEMMMTHPLAVKPAPEERWLKISLRNASLWILANVMTVQGMVCDHTAVLKALQSWIDRGVMTVFGPPMNRTTCLNIDRMKEWFNAQPDFDEGPLYVAVQVVTGGESRRPPVTTGESCRPVVTGGDSEEGRRDEDSFSGPKTKNTPHPSFNGNERLAAIIATLPRLPNQVWHANRNDSSLLTYFVEWWNEHTIAERVGQQFADSVRDALLGLILTSRTKNAPQVFFATCVDRRRIDSHVPARGADWWELHGRNATRQTSRQSPPVTASDQPETKASQAELDALEQQYGPLVDEASTDELAKLLRSEFEQSHFRRRNGDQADHRTSKLYRTLLLKAYQVLDQETATKGPVPV